MDAITEARKKYALKSKEELEAITAIELRKLASKLGISKINQDGGLVSANRGRKAELVAHILEACEAYKVQVKESIPTESEYQGSEDELDAIAQKYYEKLRDYQIKLLAENKAFSQEFPSIVVECHTEIMIRVRANAEVGQLSVNSLHNCRSTISKRIENLVLSNQECFPPNALKATFDLFYQSLKLSFASYSSERAKQQTIALNKRQNGAIEIKCVHLVNWAKNRLVTLPERESDYAQVAVAIAILTGRRQSEIMSSARFVAVDDSHVEFSGQLKKHAADATRSFEIPVLANAANAVVAGLEWLELRGKRLTPLDDSMSNQQVAAKKAHDRFSRYLSAEAKRVLNNYVVLSDGADWHLEINNKPADRRKFHLFRQIYAQIAVQQFYPSQSGTRPKLKQILTQIMGHSDSESSKKSASDSYDSDIYVLDWDDCR